MPLAAFVADGSESAAVARTVPELLAAQAALRPHAPAVMAVNGEVLTYAALHAEVERHADALAALGFGRGDRIAVALPNGPQCGIALLAATSVATCAPLDPRLDAGQAAALLAQLRAAALIVADGGAAGPAAAARAAGIMVLESPAGEGVHAEVPRAPAGAGRAPVARVAPDGDDIAILMSTSGTTGRAKIVPSTQASVVHVARLQSRAIGPGDRFLVVTPLFSRNGLGLGLLSPLATGAAAILVPGFDAARFVDWLDALRPTCYTGSAAIHSAVIDAVLARAPRLPHSLRFARASSVPLPVALQRRIEAELGVPVIQGYGTTETATIAQNPLPPGERREGSVGPAFGAEIAIADDDGSLLPTGTAGEILVRGPGVMRGYDDDPEATRQVFRGGWYRTGDLGWLDADGYLFISGRVRDLINRGGVKVAPAEVDAVLARHPDVGEAATFGIAHRTLGEDVISAVVLREGSPASAMELRAFALRELPPAKAPSEVVVTAALPRNALGKVVRRALAESFRASLVAAYVPPRDAVETLVAAVYAEVLGLPQVGALDHFFLLGGDSLRAAQVVSRLGELHGPPLPPAAVFAAPTVAELAARLAGRGQAQAAPPVPPLVRRARVAIREE